MELVSGGLMPIRSVSPEQATRAQPTSRKQSSMATHEESGLRANREDFIAGGVSLIKVAAPALLANTLNPWGKPPRPDPENDFWWWSLAKHSVG